MFYSHTLLARKTPLGTVWIAAHLERKNLKKPQIDGIDISHYAESIIIPEVPIALRLSAHLLLGLVRIYSWKVNYLAQDCIRMLNDVSVIPATQVNLPAEADRAPFESVTLPETFQLDEVELDDSVYRTEIADSHRKDYDQITITDESPNGGDEYVAVFISQDNRTESTSQTEKTNPGATTMEEDVLPPFEGGLESLAAQVLDGIDSRDPVHQTDTLAETQSAQEVPEIEIMRKAVDDLGPGNISQFPDLSNDIDNEDASVIRRKDSLSPAIDIALASGVESSPLNSHAKAPATASTDDVDILNPATSFGHPQYELQPSPVSQDHQVKKRKRKQQLYDKMIVLSNARMKKQLDDASKLLCKRKKLPCSTLDVWRYCRKRQNEQILFKSLLPGMCNDLQGTLQRSFSKPSVDSLPADSSQGLANGSSPSNIPEYDMEPELPRFDSHIEGPMAGILPSPSAGGDYTPFRSANVGERDYENTFQTEVLPTRESLAEPVSLQPVSTPGFPSMLNSSDVEDFAFLEASNASSDNATSKDGDMSARTRAVAQYFLEHSPLSKSPDNNSRVLSLNKILERRTRKQCARMFFESLVLKSHGLVEVQQEENYGDILITLMPALSESKS